MEKSRKSRTLSFFIRLLIVLTVVFSIGISGYFVVDKAVVPKYLGRYGINNLGQLIDLVRVMRNLPNEKTFITNPFTSADENNAISKLKESGVPISADGKSINFTKIMENDFTIIGESAVYFTDREMCAILGQMLQAGVLASYLPDLSYIDTLSISARQLIIELDDSLREENSNISSAAKVSLVLLIDTTAAQKHMAREMEVPLFLLNLIMPDKLFFTIEYEVFINENDEYIVSNTSLGVNGKSQDQSEILLNLLISFLFPPEEEMTIEKFGESMGDIVNTGLQILGDVKFASNIVAKVPTNGILIELYPQINNPDEPNEAEGL